MFSDPSHWNRRLARLAPWLLLVLIGLELARITWLLLPLPVAGGSGGGAGAGPSSRSRSGGSGPDASGAVTMDAYLESLRRFDPWGSSLEAKAPEPEVRLDEEAVISQLDLELIGTMVLPNDASWAVLVRKSNANEQLTLRVWEEVDGAILERVDRNAVFFRNQTRLERIELSRIDGSGRTSGPSVESQPSKVAVNISRQHYMRLVNKGAGLLAGVNVTPSNRGSQLIGYTISHVGDNSELRTLGIASGDTVQRINGVSVTDTQAITRLATRMKDQSAITVELLRGGRVHTIQIGVGR